MATHMPFEESSADAPAAELRAVMNARGYLFFRGLIPPDVVNDVRRDVLAICAGHGWLDPDQPVQNAIARKGQPPLTEGKPEYMAAYRKVLKLPRFHALPEHPAAMRIAAALLNCPEPFVHPRRIGRITFPNLVEAATPAHQDHFYIRGAVETYSCWVPLGDVPRALGGLAVLPFTHTGGFIDHNVKLEGAVGGYAVPVDEATAGWHTCDFRAGDALFFHSYTIHKALPNLTQNQLRISTDNRYQRPKDPIDPGALRPHFDLN